MNLPIPSNAAIIAAAGTIIVANGFGPLRPAAAIRTIATFEALHYSVVKVAPGWVPDCVASSKMLAALVDGWPGTAREVGPQSLPEIATRLTHRRDALSHEKSSIRVGRIDVFAAPIVRR